MTNQQSQQTPTPGSAGGPPASGDDRGRAARDPRLVSGSVGGTSSSVVAASFAKAAPYYGRHARVQSALADWLAEWLPAERTGRALEVGAGTGLFTRHLAGWPGGVTATDLSPEMCAAGSASAPWADWRVMAAEHPLPGPWDWIFSNAMLQWVEHPAEVFVAWREQLSAHDAKGSGFASCGSCPAPGIGALIPYGQPQEDRPDPLWVESRRGLIQPIPQSALRTPHCGPLPGRILAGLFVAGSLPEWQAVAGEVAPLVWRPPAAWRAELARAGLHVLRDGTAERVFTHASGRAFLRGLHGVGAAPQRQLGPGALRQRLRDYEARFGGEQGGGVRATWVFYRFEAECNP